MLLPWMPAPITTTLACRGARSISKPSSGSWKLRVPVPRHQALPPPLRALHLIERVDVEAHHACRLFFKQTREVRKERVRPVAPSAHQPSHQAAMLPQVAERVAHADPERHLEELDAVHGPRHADVDREGDPLVPDAADPGED